MEQVLEFLKRHKPDFTDPKNELVFYGGAIAAIYTAVEPFIADDSFTTMTGFATFVLAVLTFWIRSQVSSGKTVEALGVKYDQG